MKIALVHDWLTGMRGGERCLEVFCELFPRADLFTLFHRKGSVSPIIERLSIHASLLQYIPLATRYYRYLLPILPFAIRQFTLTDYDLVLSASHAVAKGVQSRGHSLHVCYCFTPMRYIWDQSPRYFPRERFSPLTWALLQSLLRHLRAWDVKTARAVDEFIAISEHIAGKIRTYYNRAAVVIPPPVDCAFFTPDDTPRSSRDPFYLVVSALVPYKCVDLAVQACERLEQPLFIIGTGPEHRKLERMATRHVHFLGWQPDAVVRHYYRHCRALIFPGEEDFGIVPLEAQACGTPVIALGKGGALETVIPLPCAATAGGEGVAPTGIFFDEPSVEALCDAISCFERQPGVFDPVVSRQQALQFDRPLFKERIKAFLASRAGLDIG